MHLSLTLDDGSSIFKRVGAALPGELAHLIQFESIGVWAPRDAFRWQSHKGFSSVTNARAIIGVLYHG